MTFIQGTRQEGLILPPGVPKRIRQSAITSIMGDALTMQGCMNFSPSWRRHNLLDAIYDTIYGEDRSNELPQGTTYCAFIGAGGSGKDYLAERVEANLRQADIPVQVIGISKIVLPLIQAALERDGITFETRRTDRVKVSKIVWGEYFQNPLVFIAPVIERILAARNQVVLITGLRTAADLLACSILGSLFVSILAPKHCPWLTELEIAALAEDCLEQGIPKLQHCIEEVGTHHIFDNSGGLDLLEADAVAIAAALAETWQAANLVTA